MADEDLTPKALLAEKSLWDIYKQSRKIPFNKFNVVCTLSVFILVTIQYCMLTDPLSLKLQEIRNLAFFGLTTSATILGFLLAGFTIFATISQPDLLVAMSAHRHSESQLSYLKHNFFIFIRVFIYYLAYTVGCLLILIFGIKSGLMHKIVEYFPIRYAMKEWLIGAAYVFLYAGMFYLIMQLKSFIYNVFHAVMTAIRWKATNR